MFHMLARFGQAALLLFLFICFAAKPGFAQISVTGSNSTISSNATANAFFHEELIDFTEDDPELVGHTRSEDPSNASQMPAHQNPEKLKNATHPAENHEPGATNSTTHGNNGTALTTNATQPLVKVIPPKGPQPSALRLFRLIPPTIFENTIEGLREDEKQFLMDTGETDFWVMTALSDEELVISTKAPETDTQATLKLFRADNGDTIIAMGVTAGDSCALELWKNDTSGRLTPMPVPDEPVISDFLKENRVLPENTDVSMLFCLDPLAEGLVAKPLIWTPSGLDKVRLDTKVIYAWDGRTFIKKILAIDPKEP